MKRWTATVSVAAIAAATAVIGAAPPAAAVAPTDAPELTAPTAGEAIQGNPVLRWSAVPGAVKYRVQVARAATFATLLWSTDTYALRATPGTDLPLGTLYWRVAATDGSSGVGPFAGSEFSKLASAQPAPVSPEDGATLAYPTSAPVLRWTAVPGVKNYRVEVHDTADFVGATAYTTANTSLALTAPLILDKDYYWHVQGVSATLGVTTDYSVARRFRSTWRLQDGRPTLTAPIGGATVDVTDVVFRWSAVPGAKDYQIQVNPNEDFANNMTDDVVVSGTQYSPPKTYDNATYFWRVRARDTGTTAHQGPWSTVGVFKRSWLAQPLLVSPRDGIQAPTQRFEWTRIAHASEYEVQLSEDPNFSSFAAKCTTFNTSVTATIKALDGGNGPAFPDDAKPTAVTPQCVFSLNIGGHYYWRVRGLDNPAGVQGVWSDATDFFWVPPSSPNIIGSGPAEAPVLSWERLPGFSRYRVVITKLETGVATTVDTHALSYSPTFELADGKAYSWYVVGLNTFGKPGLIQETGSFTYSEPDGGNTLSPVAASTDDLLTMPSLTWQPLTGASHYTVYAGVQGSNIFTALSGTTKVYQTAYTHAASLLGAGTYDWYVQANTGATSALGTFTIADSNYVQYVSPPNCVLPECVATQPTTPELAWQPVVGAGSYRVHVALDKDFTNLVRTYTTEGTTLTPRESYLDNAAGQSYFWFVQPCRTATVCGPFEDANLAAHVQAFRKKSAAVQLTSPANEATVGDVVPFEWQDYQDTAPDGTAAKQYRLQVATDDRFTNLIDTALVDQTSYEAWDDNAAYPDGVYYWRVQALDGGAAPLTWSTTRQFRKAASVPQPGAAPPAESAGLPTLTWAPMACASGYAVEVYSGTAAEFPSNSRVLSTTTKLPAATPSSPLPAGQYSWRVRKLDPDANGGGWSTGVPTFTVRQPAAELLNPADGVQLAMKEAQFTWTSVAGAAAYQFEASTSTAFATVLERISTVMTTWAPAAKYVDGATYYWRVRVLDGAGNVMSTSLPRMFVSNSALPAVTAVAPTTKVPLDGVLTVTFSKAVQGVSATSVVLTAAGSTAPVPGTIAQPSPTTATYRPLAPLVAGQYYDLVVGQGITDTTGATMAPSTTRIRAVNAVENTSPALVQRWDVDATASASGGAYASSRLGGSYATLAFTGTSVTVLGHASSRGGNADVYLDGVRQTTVSFYSRTEVHRKAVWGKSGLANRAHTLLVKVLGTKPAASLSTAVDLDAFIAGGATYQETSPGVTTNFARVFTPAAKDGNYDRAIQDADSSGAEYRFSFRGTGFSWLAAKTPDGGLATVYIDGVNLGTAKHYSRMPVYKAAVYTTPSLVDGLHTVRLVLTGTVPTGSTGTSVTLDSITTR